MITSCYHEMQIRSLYIIIPIRKGMKEKIQE